MISFAAKNPQFPRETYGRWAELIKATNPGVFDQGQEQVRTTDEPPASTQCPAAATAEWLLTSNPSTTPTFTTTNETNEAQASGSNPVKTTLDGIPAKESTSTARPAPTLAEFRVPANLVEHNLIVQRLLSGGSNRAEAEQTIALRKTAFNKALREHKRDNNQSAPRSINTRKNSKTSKPVNNNSTNH